MGNDFFTAFITRKKMMLINLSELFFKFFVGDKVKIKKYLEQSIDIYMDDFYYECNDNVEELKEYFSVNSFDNLLMRKAALSTIKTYKANDLDIDKNKNLIIIISNAVYFALLLEDVYWEKRNSPGEAIDHLFNKNAKKIRIAEDKKINDLRTELLKLLKAEDSAYNKFFKTIDNMQYSISTDKILDCYKGYLVTLNADIKPLLKYSDKEKEQIINSRGILLDYAIISLELAIISLIRDLLSGCKENIYFVKIPISCFEKQKNRQTIDIAMSHFFLKKHIILLFDYHELKDNHDLVLVIKNSGYTISVTGVERARINTNSFKDIKYVFSTNQFIEEYHNYKDDWKETKFIIS